jgi:hypothetical protein
MTHVRHAVVRKKASHRATTRVRLAGEAEAAAKLAIGYAYAASDEAEYAVLEAILARANSGDPAGPGSGPG